MLMHLFICSAKKMYFLHKAASAVYCIKPNASQWKATLRDERRVPESKLHNIPSQIFEEIRRKKKPKNDHQILFLIYSVYNICLVISWIPNVSLQCRYNIVWDLSYEVRDIYHV